MKLLVYLDRRVVNGPTSTSLNPKNKPETEKWFEAKTV